MLGGWLVVLPLLVAFDKATLQPIIKESHTRHARLSDPGECCPCSDLTSTGTGSQDNDGLTDNSMSPSMDCPCQPRASDAEASPSILRPALRVIQPFVRHVDEGLEPKPLLQPEVGLASSVLETLRKATDEEYQDALARDAARSAVRLIESDISILGDSVTESPKNVVRIYLNANDNDMDDNLPEPSHIQETRCIHPTLENTPTITKLKMKEPKLQHKNLYKYQQGFDSGTGASNIQERVLQPNARSSLQKEIDEPNLNVSGLFARDSLDEGHDSDKRLGKVLTDSPFASNKVSPKSNFKLRNLLENLETANKEKLKLPAIDLKKYFATTTKLPPLKFNPLEKSMFHHSRPLKIKDLLKLKDVELVPRHDFTKNAFDDKIKEPDNKILKSQILVHFDDKKQKYSNDEAYDTNVAPSVNREITSICKPTSSERIDTITNPTNLYPSVHLENSKSSVNNHDDNDNNHINRMFTPLNSNRNLFSSRSLNSESRESIDYEDTGSKNKVNSNEFLMKSTSETEDFIQNCLSQQITNEEVKKQELQKEVQTSDSNEQNLYQIESLEELDLPIEYDNSSRVPELDLQNTGNDQNSQELLNDPIAAANNNNLKIKKENIEDSHISRLFTDSIISNVDSDEQLFKHTDCTVDLSNENLIHDKEAGKYRIIKTEAEQPKDTNILSKRQEIKTSSQKQTGMAQSILGENPRQISFQTLQNMSNSILKLSEGETLHNANDNLDAGFSEALADVSQNEEDFEDLNNKRKENFNEKGETIEKSDQSSNGNSCKTTEMDDIKKSEIGNLAKNSFTKKSEMIADSSVPNTAFATHSDSDSGEPTTSLPPTGMDDVFLNVVTEPSVDMTSILPLTRLPVIKHSNILNNLKSKFENLFTTTEKVSKNTASPNLEDSINESSNNKPIIAKFDGLKTLAKSKQPPHKPLDALAPKIPGLSLKSYKNKLAAPKSLDPVINLDPALNSRLRLLEPSTARTAIEKGRNVQAPQYKKLRNPETISDHEPDLDSPLQLANPFESTFDPSSALGIFANNIRSHAESALKNVKETFESHLKEPHFLEPLRQSGTHDILDLTDKRDEFNRKLQAIHTDINDKFNTFQQSILNRFNLPSLEDSAFREDSSDVGLRSTYYPLSKESSFKEAVKPQKVTNKLFPKSLSNPSLVTEDSRAERKYKSPKLTELWDLSQSRHLEKLQPDLKQNTMNKQGVLLKENKFPTIKQNILPTFNADRKSSRIDPAKILKTVTLPNLRTSNIPILSEKSATKNKVMFTKPENMNRLSKEPGTSSTHTLPSTINVMEKTSAEETITSEENIPTHSTVNKLRKALLEKNANTISKNNLKVPLLRSGSSMSTETDSNPAKKGLLSRLREGNARQYLKDAENVLAKSQEDEISSISFNDATHSAAQNLERVRVVEPLKENVPYKCKLICYKDL